MQTVHLIELKFGMHIIIHRLIYCIDFGELRIDSFFKRSTKMYSYTLWPMDSNYLECSSIQMAHSIDLKYDVYVL